MGKKRIYLFSYEKYQSCTLEKGIARSGRRFPVQARVDERPIESSELDEKA